MKKYITLFTACAALSLGSCTDFLDVEAEGNVTTTNVFENDNDAIDAVDGLYYRLSSGDNMFGRTIMYEQAGANDMVWGRNRSWNQLALNGANGDESPLREIFEDFYGIMSRANFVVRGLSEKGSLSAIETRSLGEAYFMRAMCHLIMAYRYGTDKVGVPFIRYEDYGDDFNVGTIPPQQASVMENYKLICEDLDNAEKLLPKFEDYGAADQGRPHKAAALGYKVRTLAYWACWDASKWNEVIEGVNKLEGSYGRGLVANFDDLFSSDFEKFFTNEYIFGIAGDGKNNAGTEMVGVMFENKGWGMYNGWGYFKPTNDIYEEFLKDGDRDNNPRLRRSILSYGDEFTVFGTQRKFWSTSDNESGFAIYKYYDPYKYGNNGVPNNDYVNANGDWPTARINFPLMRFAEMLLFRAEGYLMTGQAGKATDDLNRLRKRAHVAEIKGTATTADLYHERRVELAFEVTDHLYDLKRWAHAGDATLKELALKELNNAPKVRHYAQRDDFNSPFTVGDYLEGYVREPYQDKMIVFPYPSDVIAESDGAYKQNR